MVPEIEILMPKATKNLILNPSVENNIAGWIPFPQADGQIARFEWDRLVSCPDGFDRIDDADNQFSIQKQAALSGSLGLAVTMAGTGTVARGQFDDPDAEKQMTVITLLDLNDFVMNAFSNFIIIRPTNLPFRASLRETGGDIYVFFTYRDDTLTDFNSADLLVPFPGTSEIRIDWYGAANPGDNDGYIRGYIDGELKYEVLNIDNDTLTVPNIVFGATSAPNANNTGSFHMDNCQWFRSIGNFVIAEPTLERARFGRKSLKVQTPGVNNAEGIYYRADTTNINGPVVGSAYVRGSGDIRLRLIDGASGEQYVSQVHQLHDRYWQRLFVEGIAIGGDDYRVYIETVGTVPQEKTLYIDGIQLERGGVLTTYCDGDQEGCRWNGVFHASTSERESTSMAGGEWIPWRDDECEPDSYYTEVSGFGMPPITLNRQMMALTAGSFYDSTRIEERVMIINSFFRDRGAQKRKGNEIKHLFELRQRIEDLIKPDNNPNQDPFWLRFGQDGKWLYIQAHYESGMEFDLDVRNKWTSASSIRFIAMQPYFTEDSQETELLDYGQEIGDSLHMMGRIDGEWQQLFNGVEGDLINSGVRNYIFDENNRIYVCGAYLRDDDGNDIRCLSYSNDDYTALIQAGPGIVGPPAGPLVFIKGGAAHPNGKLYFGGVFNEDGNGIATYGSVFEYDPIANTYDDLNGGLWTTGGGTVGIVEDVQVASSGNVYFAGNFGLAGGAAGAPANNIAYWNGAWQTVGDIEAETNCNNIHAIVVISDDEIYAFGSDTGGNDEVAWKWDGSNWSVIYSVGETGSRSEAAVLDNDGSIVFAVTRGTSDDGFLARWNGASVEQLGPSIQGIDPNPPSIDSLAIDSEGNIYLAVLFAEGVGSLIPEGFLFVWNGTSYASADIISDLNASAIGAVRIDDRDDVYVGFLYETNNNNASSITNLNNVGTAQVFPIIAIEGPGKILWIENQTTKQIAYMNYTNQENELLEIDFRTGEKTVTSNYRGSVPDAILPNSEDILLAAGTQDEPKSNKFAVLIVDSVKPTVQLRYTPTHWSIDALDNF